MKLIIEGNEKKIKLFLKFQGFWMKFNKLTYRIEKEEVKKRKTRKKETDNE